MEFNIFDVVTAGASVTTAGFAIGIFFYGRRQAKFDFIERSFDVLQRVNEKALESGHNALAAVQSGNIADTTDEKNGLILYFHYMRINRIFRAYQYHKGKFIDDDQLSDIVRPHIGTLKSIEKDLRKILKRGYPDDFADYLCPLVEDEKLVPPPALNWVGDHFSEELNS